MDAGNSARKVVESCVTQMSEIKKKEQSASRIDKHITSIIGIILIFVEENTY